MDKLLEFEFITDFQVKVFIEGYHLFIDILLFPITFLLTVTVSLRSIYLRCDFCKEVFLQINFVLFDAIVIQINYCVVIFTTPQSD